MSENKSKPKYYIDKILAMPSPEFTFFWGHTAPEGQLTNACFSQWWRSDFVIDGVSYNCAEQYMMAQKALLFGDEDVYRQIMRQNEPQAIKQLGRMVAGYNDALWEKHRREVVLRANIAKFTQNDDLRQYLLQTGNSIIVEASPYDCVWGIGMSVNEMEMRNPKQWKGQNLLGFILMEVRDNLRGQQASEDPQVLTKITNSEIMYDRRFTPEYITHLQKNEIFVFGSNLNGLHAGGAARAAYNHFGAIWGQGVGLQGQSYAIPTMHGDVEAIKPYIDVFIEFADLHREYVFFVTRIGCGIAGFTEKEMAPLFEKAVDLANVILPKDFVEIIVKQSNGSENTKAQTWNSLTDFIEEYNRLMQEMKNGNQFLYGEVKRLRIKEYRNTIDIVNNGCYLTEENEKVTICDTDKMISGTRFYSEKFDVNDIPKTDTLTTIDVVNSDCMTVGMKLLGKGYNPAILNMASHLNPGGGVTVGAGAQEETIFRRSNIFKSLYQYAPYAGKYGLPKSQNQYPLDLNYGGIYTPCVTVFREEEPHGYKLMSQPCEIAFISVAAIIRPELDDDGKIIPPLVEITKNKIRTILRIGLKHGHDSLVLGALGCGAFRNPPCHMARLFHEVLMESEFANKYRHIVFAILEDHNSHLSHNKEGNFMPFKREFSSNEIN